MVTYPYWMSLVPFGALLFMLLLTACGHTLYARISGRNTARSAPDCSTAARTAAAAGLNAGKGMGRKRFKPAA